MLWPRHRIIVALGLLCVFAALSSALAAEADKPRLDATGEPLPAEAVQRLGSLLFRTQMLAGTAAVSPDGKTIALLNDTGVALFDPGTGKEVKRLNKPGLAGSSGLMYSPDGKTLAVMGFQNTLLLDAESGNERGRLEAGFQQGGFGSISYSTDGQRIAVGASNWRKTNLSATVWDAEGFKKLHSFEVVQDGKVYVALSGDGKRLATWGQNHNRDGAQNTDTRTIQLWDTVTGKELKKLIVEGSVDVVALSPDGKELAVAEDTSSLSIWDVETAKVVHRLVTRRSRGRLLRYSPDGKVLVAGSNDGTVQLWETPNYLSLGLARAGNCTLSSVAFLPEKKVLVLGFSAQALRVFEAPSGRILSPLEGHTGPIRTLQFSRNGKKILSGGADGVWVWDAATGKSERRALFPDPPDSVRGAAPRHYLLSPDGRTVLTGVPFNHCRLLDMAMELEYGLDACSSSTGINAAFSADGKTMAAVTWTLVKQAQGVQQGVRIWDLASGREGPLLSMKMGTEYAVAVSADGKYVLGASNAINRDGRQGQSAELTLWDTATGKEYWTITRDHQWVECIAFSPAGDLIAIEGNTRLALLDVATGAEVQAFENAAKMQVYSLLFSPDGRSLAAGGFSPRDQTGLGTVRLWETATAKPRVEYSDHLGPVNALAFSPDGRLLASGSSDTTILLWDLTGKLNADVRAAARPKPAEFDALWNDLNDSDAAKSYRLVQRLAAYPEEAVALVKAKLPPAKSKTLDAAMIDRMIAQLDHDDFTRREEASKFLAKAGKAIEPALTKALAAQPSSEKKRRLLELLEALKVTGPSPDMVRPTRALEVLERLGTPEARQLLEELAKGDKNAQLTRDAKATLKRLGASLP
jgi:WD40 repeat protein